MTSKGINTSAAEDLKRARIGAGMTRPQACELLKVPLRSLENWELGYCPIKPVIYTAIMDAYKNAGKAGK